MTKRSRLIWFGLAGALVLAGVVAAVIGGNTALIVAFVLIGLGLVLATSLVFLEVGLSEDRDRAQERARERRERRDGRDRPRARLPRPPGRTRRAGLDRSRGHRRRLR